MSKSKSLVLNCFSPPVMLATLAIEGSLAGYALWRYKLTSVTKLIVALLLALGTFQLAEYLVCTGYGANAENWSRLGFVAITALPPLGVHIMHELAGKPKRALVNTAYATMAGFMVFFLTYKTAFIGHQCTGNYVIFQLGNQISGLYSMYYYGWLFVGITLGIHWANELREQGKASIKKLETVKALLIGYLVFLVPVAVANTIRPETRRGIPSIMCGFAVLLAMILALYILPRVGEIRDRTAATIAK